jgi:hypothetical protein
MFQPYRQIVIFIWLIFVRNARKLDQSLVLEKASGGHKGAYDFHDMSALGVDGLQAVVRLDQSLRQAEDRQVQGLELV